MTCELCVLEKRTTLYYEDDTWVVLDCRTCKVPMAVYKKHGQLPTAVGMIFILGCLCRLGFGDKQIRTQQKKIKDHFHFHTV